METLPFKLIETTGDEALVKWQELKSAAQGSPVVLGGNHTIFPFGNLSELLSPDGPKLPPLPSPEDILRTAAGLRFPDDLAKRKTVYPPPIGGWPASPHPSMGLSVAKDSRAGKPLPKVYIGLVPTDDWTTIPAYLRWGGWNGCPAAEYHVAAMRAWRDRYGAELIGMSVDTINIRVAAKPKTRDDALALARDHYIYCTDIIDQDVETYSALAADLMANDWWFFWWD
jgi:hypothetical protein